MKLNITNNEILESLFSPDLSDVDEQRYRDILNIFHFKNRTGGKGDNWYFTSHWVKSYYNRYYNLSYNGRNNFNLHLNYKQSYYGNKKQYLDYNKYCDKYEVDYNYIGDVYSVTWFTGINELYELLNMVFHKDLRTRKLKKILEDE